MSSKLRHARTPGTTHHARGQNAKWRGDQNLPARTKVRESCASSALPDPADARPRRLGARPAQALAQRGQQLAQLRVEAVVRLYEHQPAAREPAIGGVGPGEFGGEDAAWRVDLAELLVPAGNR